MKFFGIAGICLLCIGLTEFGLMTVGMQQEQKPIRPQDTLYSYQRNVLPLLQSNCNPCHFPGGKVYKKLPFDDYKTVASIGKKLNTRLKKKDQQAMISKWIELGAIRD